MNRTRNRLVGSLAFALALPLVACGPSREVTRPTPLSRRKLQELVRKDSNDATLQYALALAYWRDRKFDEADTILRLATRLAPRYAGPYLTLAFLPYARRPELYQEEIQGRVPDSWQSKLLEANRFYRQAFMLDPLIDLRILSLVFPLDERGFRDYTSEASQTYELYVEGFVDLTKGRYGLAYERLERLARVMYDGEKHPERVPDFLLWHRGLAAAHSGRFPSAVADFRALVERGERKERQDALMRIPLRTNEYRFMLAELEQRAHQPDIAEALLKEAVANDLGLYMAHVNLASMYEGQKRWPDAVSEWQRAVAANPEDFSLALDLGKLLFNLERTKEAEEPVQRAVALCPRDALGHYLLGRIHEELGRPSEAKDEFKRFIELAPSVLEDIVADARQRLAKLP